ncbi:hypothetical protein ACFL2O_02435 [Thermodesulfobacteriota bacterium]
MGKVIWNIKISEMEFSKYWKSGALTVSLYKLILRFPEAVITNSYTARKHHLKLGYKLKRFEVIPNPMDSISINFNHI